MDKEKVLTEEKALAEELLTEDELDKVAGGGIIGTGDKVISTPSNLQNKPASSGELPGNFYLGQLGTG